ncbi:MAG: DinB family protein [Bacteroidetes bacterium]|nr:DinB family protein [Bacteroidota bacterium]
MKDPIQAIDIWIIALGEYSFDELIAKPAPDFWSIGQLYMHLIIETCYYLEQAMICASSNDDALNEMSSAAKNFFENNSFPKKRIQGSPEHAYIPQPTNNELIMDSLMDLKNKFAEAQIVVAKTGYKGKTKHPGLGYFNAIEWLQFAEMHLKHHISQKKRNDIFLGKRLGSSY